MIDLPQPLTPADCDLRGLPFMPLDVIRLLDSDMFAEATGDEFKAAVALWCKSWTQIPAASLPNKDPVLAHLSGAKNWKRVRDGAMRGWILCTDDRWYHPVVAEKALAALPGREEFNSRKSADAERKAREREDRKALFEILRGHGVVPDWNVSTKVLRGMAAQYLSLEPPDIFSDQSRDMSQGVTVSKGEGEGERKGEGELTSKEDTSSSHPPTTPPEPERPDETIAAMARHVQIALLLRSQGVLATAQNPIVAVTFAEDERITDDVLNLAIAKAKAAKPGEQIPLKYLQRVIETELTAQATPAAKIAAPQKGDPGHWQQSAKAIEAKGKSLGMQQGATELLRDYAIRIQATIDQRKGQS